MRAVSLRIIALAAALTIGLAAAAPAGASLPAPPEAEPRTSVIHSLNESPGCGGPDGVRGPYGTRSGSVERKRRRPKRCITPSTSSCGRSATSSLPISRRSGPTL